VPTILTTPCATIAGSPARLVPIPLLISGHLATEQRPHGFNYRQIIGLDIGTTDRSHKR
jgi:hypothetical protein